MSLDTGRQLELKDAIDDAASLLGVALEDAPAVVWRLAWYGGHVGTVPSSVARPLLDHVLELAKAAGAWIRYDARGEAEAVNLAEWRETKPVLTLFRAVTAQRDRWSSVTTSVEQAGPIHARLGAGIGVAPVSLCGGGVVAAESQGRMRAIDLPNPYDDWCVSCEQRAAELLDG